jgi:MOSC domain-containing protein YiiM
MAAVEICHIYISPGHNFVGHYGQEPDKFPAVEVPSVRCVAGRGLIGDRYFDHKEDYKGQITFISLEIFEQLCADLELQECLPSLPRRNVITRGVDLNELIGKEFEVQGVRFLGTQECAPCDWMERVIGPGAKQRLKGNGGLRAKILSDGELRSTASIPQTA